MTKSVFGGMFSRGGAADSFISKVNSNMSWGTLGIILIVLLFFIVAIYYYYKVIAPKMNPTYKANSENIPVNSGSNKQAELLLYSVDWCPHCKTAKPEWDSLKQEYQGKIINGYSIIFTDVNCTNETPEVEKLMNTYKVEGYPTIKLLKDGQVIEYDAKPTKATLTQFLNSVL